MAVTSDDRTPASNPEWADTLRGTNPGLLRARRIFDLIPSDPRCRMCHSPRGGIGGPVMRLIGFGAYPPNPQICTQCYRKFAKSPGGAEVGITALFADVRGSTGLAETMSAAAYSSAVNDYLKAATQAIREPGGLVAKLLGDGIMALFIPGFVDGANAARGVDAGREILRRVRLPVGVGVHTGTAWVGFVGDVDGVMDFTALGDAVNVASRLGSEAAPGELLVSGSTAAEAGMVTDGLDARTLELRGRAQPLDAWAERVEATATTA